MPGLITGVVVADSNAFGNIGASMLVKKPMSIRTRNSVTISTKEV
jgi:hypothetical protein